MVRDLIAERNRWLALAVLAGCLLPVAVDATILYIAVPTLIPALGATDRQVLWMTDIYPLMTAGLVLVTGPLGDRIGHSRLLTLGLLVFGAASLAAAFAPTPAAMIAARALLAVGCAMIIPSTLALIRQLFADPHEQAVAIGVWGAVASAGAAAGPLLGGVLLEHFWWGAIFLINLPLVLLLAPAVLRVLVNRPAAVPPPWELLSPLLGIVGIVGFVYAVKAFAHPGPASAVAWPALAGGLLALALFVRRQLRSAHPLLDLRLFRHRRFRQGVLAALVPSGVLWGFELLLAQDLQFVLALSPLQAGLFLLPLPLGAFVGGPLGGYLAGRFGARGTVVGSLAVALLGYLGLALLAGAQASAAVQLCLALMGLGHGVIMAAATGAIMSSAPEHQAGGAAAFESVCFEVGGGLGIALFGSLVAGLYAGAFLLPAGIDAASLTQAAGHSIGEAVTAAADLAPAQAEALVAAAREAFSASYRIAAAVGAGLLLLTLVCFVAGGRADRPETA